MNSKNLMVVVSLSACAIAYSEEPNHHHHRMAKDVGAFHDALAPLWHTRPGPDRLPNACAKTGELGKLAKEIRSSDASKLNASIASMDKACLEKQGDVDAAFHDVHEAFHQLMGANHRPVKRTQ